MNIQHSSRHDKWYTPLDIVESARFVLCGDLGRKQIDCDPASDAFGNSRVRASRYFTEEGTDWYRWPRMPGGTSVFLNPPGGKTGNKSNAVAFWESLMDFARTGFMSHAIFVSFSVEHLQTTQKCYKSMLDFPICFPRKRVRYETDGATPKRPSHSSCIVYLPGECDNTAEFVEEFSKYGKVKV